MRVKSFVLAAAASGMLITGANAAEYTVQSDMLDHEAHLTVSSGVTAVSNGHQGDNRIGHRTSGTLSSSILPFALPSLAPGEVITGATLNITFEGESASLMIEATDGNVDLYGLPYDASPITQEASRYFSGPSDATAGVTKLQDNIMTPGDYPAEGTFAPKVSVDISDYLNSLFAAGATAGDFAVLRLSYDVATHNGTNNRYRVVTSGGDGPDGIDTAPHTIAEGAPHLIITTVVPEPGGLALLGLGGLGLIRRRRSR